MIRLLSLISEDISPEVVYVRACTATSAMSRSWMKKRPAQGEGIRTTLPVRICSAHSRVFAAKPAGLTKVQQALYYVTPGAPSRTGDEDRRRLASTPSDRGFVHTLVPQLPFRSSRSR
jgi:hypothetical protein